MSLVAGLLLGLCWEVIFQIKVLEAVFHLRTDVLLMLY